MRCVCIKGRLQEASASPFHICTSCLVSRRLDNCPIFGGLCGVRCVNPALLHIILSSLRYCKDNKIIVSKSIHNLRLVRFCKFTLLTGFSFICYLRNSAIIYKFSNNLMDMMIIFETKRNLNIKNIIYF